MFARISVSVAVALIATSLARPLFAQSLADVAKKEEERRKTIKAPSKVLTNGDLKPGIGSAVPAESADESAKADAAKDAKDKDAKDADAKDGKKESDAKKAAEPVKDQKYWSGRWTELQAKLRRDQAFADALQSRINALNTDFVNRDDPAQRAVIATDRQKAIDEMNRLKQDIQDDQKAIADLQEDARRAGVPAGWLR
jgi:hypothetical protein